MKKYLFTFILFSLCQICDAQKEAIAKKISNEIALQINIVPPEAVVNNCYYFNTLLKITIKNYQTTIQFSDNAELWLRNELFRYETSSSYSRLAEIAKADKLKKGVFIIPLIIRSVSFPCQGTSKDWLTKKDFFLFDGKKIEKNANYFDAFEITLSSL